MLIGSGFTVAGSLCFARKGPAGRGRRLPGAVLAPGVYIFVALVPTVNAPDPIGRLGIGGWMLLFAVLGYALTQLNDHGRRRR